VKKNLQWYDKSDVGVVVNAHELYNEFVKYKLANKSVSKLVIAQGQFQKMRNKFVMFWTFQFHGDMYLYISVTSL
jgi:hypothetical protein